LKFVSILYVLKISKSIIFYSILQGGRKETWLRDMYDAAMDGVMDKLLMASDPSGQSPADISSASGVIFKAVYSHIRTYVHAHT
jgi:hypothetical protein